MLNTDYVHDLLMDIHEDVVTLYLHVDPGHQPNQNTPPAWQIYVKNAISEIESRLDDPNAQQWHHTRVQLDTFLRDHQPQGKSLVIFVGEDFVHHHDLPIVLENRHAYGEPMVVPLLWALDEYEQYLVALVDQEEAKFMSAYLGSAVTNEEIRIDFDEYDFREKRYKNNNSNGRVAGQGSSKDQFDATHDAHLSRFYNEVAERIRALMRDNDATRIILGGSEQAAHAVRDALHEKQQQQVVGILNIPMESATHEVADAIRQTALNTEREYELDLVEKVIGFAKAGGRGALGSDAVEEAFTMQQVETLILPYPPQDMTMASDLTLRALHMGVNVELVHGSPAMKLRQEGEVAAKLYYAIE